MSEPQKHPLLFVTTYFFTVSLSQPFHTPIVLNAILCVFVYIIRVRVQTGIDFTVLPKFFQAWTCLP